MTTLKQREEQINQRSLRLLEAVREQPEYSWANNDVMLTPLRTARENLQQFTHSDPFWSNWAIKEDWGVWAKKEYKEETIKAAVDAGKPVLQRLLDAVETESATLKRMHSSRALAKAKAKSAPKARGSTKAKAKAKAAPNGGC